MPNDSRQKAISRFQALAGSKGAEELVAALLSAAEDQLLETITGAGAVPSNMVGVRAELLYYACTRAERILEQREVEVLFRTLPANARAILSSMHATYEEALRNQFLARMRRGARVSASGSDEDGLSWTIAFPDTTSYDTAWDELARLDIAAEASGDRRTRVITLPRDLSGDRGASLEKLGLTGPAGDGGRRSRRR